MLLKLEESCRGSENCGGYISLVAVERMYKCMTRVNVYRANQQPEDPAGASYNRARL